MVWWLSCTQSCKLYPSSWGFIGTLPVSISVSRSTVCVCIVKIIFNPNNINTAACTKTYWMTLQPETTWKLERQNHLVNVKNRNHSRSPEFKQNPNHSWVYYILNKCKIRCKITAFENFSLFRVKWWVIRCLKDNPISRIRYAKKSTKKLINLISGCMETYRLEWENRHQFKVFSHENLTLTLLIWHFHHILMYYSHI